MMFKTTTPPAILTSADSKQTGVGWEILLFFFNILVPHSRDPSVTVRRNEKYNNLGNRHFCGFQSLSIQKIAIFTPQREHGKKTVSDTRYCG